MNRRRLFALAGGAAASTAIPAAATPVVEMHVADVTTIAPAVKSINLDLVVRYLSDFGYVDFKRDITAAEVRTIEPQIRRFAKERWEAGEDGPWVWPHG